MTRHAIAAWLSLAGSAACAHSALQGSTPASGSILPASPERISLRFGEPTGLTSLTVVSASGERSLGFLPIGSASEFHANAPALEAGRNELRWRALSQDGHVVEGTIIVVVRPPKP